jgi:hypothetical protein
MRAGRCLPLAQVSAGGFTELSGIVFVRVSAAIALSIPDTSPDVPVPVIAMRAP